MLLVPARALRAADVLGATGDYGKQNVPYGPAVAEILASNPDRPSVILASDHQLAGNLRLHAPDIPVTLPGYEDWSSHSCSMRPIRCWLSGAAG